MKLEDQYSFLQRRLDQEQAYFKKNKHNKRFDKQKFSSDKQQEAVERERFR